MNRVFRYWRFLAVFALAACRCTSSTGPSHSDERQFLLLDNNEISNAVTISGYVPFAHYDGNSLLFGHSNDTIFCDSDYVIGDTTTLLMGARGLFTGNADGILGGQMQVGAMPYTYFPHSTQEYQNGIVDSMTFQEIDTETGALHLHYGTLDTVLQPKDSLVIRVSFLDTARWTDSTIMWVERVTVTQTYRNWGMFSHRQIVYE